MYIRGLAEPRVPMFPQLVMNNWPLVCKLRAYLGKLRRAVTSPVFASIVVLILFIGFEGAMQYSEWFRSFFPGISHFALIRMAFTFVLWETSCFAVRKIVSKDDNPYLIWLEWHKKVIHKIELCHLLLIGWENRHSFLLSFSNPEKAVALITAPYLSMVCDPVIWALSFLIRSRLNDPGNMIRLNELLVSTGLPPRVAEIQLPPGVAEILPALSDPELLSAVKCLVNKHNEGLRTEPILEGMPLPDVTELQCTNDFFTDQQDFVEAPTVQVWMATEKFRLPLKE